jgi:ligand-binding sensor domain-containing protein
MRQMRKEMAPPGLLLLTLLSLALVERLRLRPRFFFCKMREALKAVAARVCFHGNDEGVWGVEREGKIKEKGKRKRKAQKSGLKIEKRLRNVSVCQSVNTFLLLLWRLSSCHLAAARSPPAGPAAADESPLGSQCRRAHV